MNDDDEDQFEDDEFDPEYEDGEIEAVNAEIMRHLAEELDGEIVEDAESPMDAVFGHNSLNARDAVDYLDMPVLNWAEIRDQERQERDARNRRFGLTPHQPVESSFSQEADPDMLIPPTIRW